MILCIIYFISFAGNLERHKDALLQSVASLTRGTNVKTLMKPEVPGECHVKQHSAKEQQSVLAAKLHLPPQVTRFPQAIKSDPIAGKGRNARLTTRPSWKPCSNKRTLKPLPPIGSVRMEVGQNKADKHATQQKPARLTGHGRNGPFEPLGKLTQSQVSSADHKQPQQKLQGRGNGFQLNTRRSLPKIANTRKDRNEVKTQTFHGKYTQYIANNISNKFKIIIDTFSAMFIVSSHCCRRQSEKLFISAGNQNSPRKKWLNG